MAMARISQKRRVEKTWKELRVVAKYRACRSGEDIECLDGDMELLEVVSLAARKTMAVSFPSKGVELSLIK
jgi:hypothetical protein